MIRVSRFGISFIGAMFGLYHAVLGVFWVDSYAQPAVGWAAIGLYVAAIITTLALYRGARMPSAQAWANLFVAVTVPQMVNPQIVGAWHNTFATWYIGGLGVLMAATAVRRHRTIAWFGTAVVTFQAVQWGGFSAIFDSGVIGMALLVAAGQALSIGVERASADVVELTTKARDEAAASAATSAQRLERKMRAELALASSRPILERIVGSEGDLPDQDRTEARLAEAGLRDEIRGRELLNDSVREAVRNARIRGVEVVMLDEGGLDDADPETVTRVLADVASVIDTVATGRITVRAPSGEAWMVTVAATNRDASGPTLLLRLP